MGLRLITQLLNAHELKKIQWLLNFKKSWCYRIISVVLIWFAYLILHNVEWIFGDDYQFLGGTIIGRPSRGFMGNGRFWPLGLTDYNVLLLFQDYPSTISHFIYNIVIMVIAVVMFFHVLSNYCNKKYFIALFYVLVLFASSSFLRIHMECIFAERFMFLLQTLFMYFWLKALKNKRVKAFLYYVCAFLCANYLLYCKEPMFGMFIVISCTSLMFGRNENNKIFSFVLFLSSCLFVIIYMLVFVELFNINALYYDQNEFNHTLSNNVILILKRNPILVLVMILASIRAYHIVVKSDRAHIQLDSLLFGSAAYLIGYLILGMCRSYYFVPSFVFALPSFVYWTSYFIKSRLGLGIILCVTIMAVPSICYSKDSVTYVFNKRMEDIRKFKKFADKYRNGTQVYMFSDGTPLEVFRFGNRSKSVYWYNVWLLYVNYSVNMKNIDANMIVPINDLTQLPEHYILFYPDTAQDKYKTYMDQRSRIKQNMFCATIYEN